MSRLPLAISNIAWSPSDDQKVVKLMRRHGFAGVEVAPTKYWPNPLAAPRAAVDEVRTFWEGEGMAVVAIQSLLFGTSGMELFGEPTTITASQRLTSAFTASCRFCVA